jgi:hypothetical protein
MVRSMDRRKFVFPVFLIDGEGKPIRHLGNAFPITPSGDLLTCKHVATPRDESGDLQAIGVFDATRNRLTISKRVHVAWEELDLAVIPSGLGEGIGEANFIPFLHPEQIQVGAEVYSSGFYSNGALESLRSGYFGGKMVSAEDGKKAVRQTPYPRLVLPYPVIQGLSGSAVLTYRSGVKIVGVAFGSEEHRVVTDHIIEERDGEDVKETRALRLVEFGLAYPNVVIVAWLEDEGITGFRVMGEDERLDDPELD